MRDINYMRGRDIIRLHEMGAVCALKAISINSAYSGDTVAFYFFNTNGDEIAHKTMITKDGFVIYNRKWGDINKSHYSQCKFNGLVKDLQIQSNGLYFIG